MKIDSKKMSRTMVYHSKILLKGFIKMLFGVVTAGLIAVGVYGFLSIPAEGGYAAVSNFLISTFFTLVALGGMYLMGGNVKKGARK